MMYHGYIYITICQQENKCYVGQKAFPPNKTKSYIGSGKLLKNKIKKYGKKFFKKIVLGEVFSDNIDDFKKQLDEYEEECIYFFRSFGADGENWDSIYGYNLIKKPYGILGYKFSDDDCKKRSDTLKGRPSEKKGVKLSQEHCDNISKGMIGINVGKKHSEEYGINISIRLTGRTLSKDHIENTRLGRIGKVSGKNGSNYKEIYYEYLIIGYMKGILIDQLINNYNDTFNDSLKRRCYQRFLDTMGWPLNSLKLKKKSIYLKFIDENKYKIEWYIENYERLEEEYFEKKHNYKYKGLFPYKKE